MSYDVFISYARKDNERPMGAVSALVEALVREHRRFTTEELAVFFDREEIRAGQDWELRLQTALRDSRLLLAILSPRYFASPWCRREWEEFVRHEVDRAAGGEGVYPVAIDETRGAVPLDDPAVATWWHDLRRRQHIDLRALLADGAAALGREDVCRLVESLDAQIDERVRRMRLAQTSPGTVDRHDAAFVGRQHELRRLRQILLGEGRVGVMAVLHGLGGMGKSALATAYAHAYAAEYPGGRWLVPCESVTDLAVALLRLAAPLGVDVAAAERGDPDVAARRIVRELETRTIAARSTHVADPACLLILDNVDVPALLAPSRTAWLPAAPWLHVVVTTRLAPDHIATPHQVASKEREFVPVDELPDDDGVELIARHQPGGRFATGAERDAARDLVRQLGGFALAVEAAAVYLGTNPEISCADFRARTSGDTLVAIDDVVAGVEVRHRAPDGVRHLAAILDASGRDLSHGDHFVLACASVLPPQHVPLPWIRSVVERAFPGATDAPAGHPSPWSQSVRRLLGRRLLLATADVDERGLPRVVRMHRLVQEHVRARDPAMAANAEAMLIEHAVERARALRSTWHDSTQRWEVVPLAACVEHWARPGAPHIGELALLTTAPLTGLGLFREAERLSRLAVTVAADGSTSETILAAAVFGAVAPAVSTHAREGEAALRRTLPLAEDAFGGDSDVVATILEVLACVVLGRGDAGDECFGLLDRAARVRERAGDHAARARGDAMRAVVELQYGRSADAAQTARRALDAFDAAGDGAVQAGRTLALAVLGAVHAGHGRFPDAQRALERAVTAASEVFTPEHPLTKMVEAMLGGVLVRMGRVADAEALLRRAIEQVTQRVGADADALAPLYAQLAAALQQSGRTDEAESLHRRVLAITTATYGDDSLQVADALRELAVFLGAQRRAPEAEPLLRRALAIQEAARGDADPEVAKTLIVLGYVAWRLRRPGEFASLTTRARQIFARYRHTAGHEHPYRALLGPLDLVLGVTTLGCLVAAVAIICGIGWLLFR